MSFRDNIYTGTKENLVKEILDVYAQKGFAVVNFLYFASIIEGKLSQKDKEEKYLTYQKTLEECDFLLPDGIALLLVFKKHFKKTFENLNGTDFMPYFLDQIKDQKPNLILYGAFDQDILVAYQNLSKKYPEIEISHFQHGYKEFERDKIKTYPDRLNILIEGRGSPRQENWAYQNIDKIKQHGLLVFTVGGLFDFWAGKEVRAPWMIRKLKGERVWRFLLNPKKNAKKFCQSFAFLHFLLKKEV